jgi:ferredoxin-NADP reductase
MAFTRTALASLTTPLLPRDLAALVNPLWSRTLRARVLQVRPETAQAATIVLQPGSGWRGHSAGQHVSVGVEISGVRHTRTYSLTTPDGRQGPIAITVKAVPDGLVSNQLVRRTRVGDLVTLGQAEGDFTLPTNVPPALLMITAGSGITPVMGMLRQLGGTGCRPDVVHVHSAATGDEVIFGAELRAMAHAAHIVLHERHTARDGVLPVADIATVCPDWTERQAWVCGPGTMLDDAAEHWQAAGVLDRLHVERFRSALAPLDPHAPAGGTVRFGDVAVQVGNDTTLLDAGERAGVILPSGCRSGICHSCVVPLLAGTVRDVRDGSLTSSHSGSTNTRIQTCISAPVGDVSLLAGTHPRPTSLKGRP